MKIPINNHLRKFIAACGFLALLTPAYAASDSLELCSPKNDDHFEVTKPLLFWHTSQDAKRYEVFIDNAKVTEVPATPVIQHNHEWMMYYGAGDRNVGLATCPATPGFYSAANARDFAKLQVREPNGVVRYSEPIMEPKESP